ncbi:MAG: SPOR domain-containing protein [Myxococcota bacterium]
MRDLERIQERDPNDGGLSRRAGAFALAALATLAVVYAMSLQLAPAEVGGGETDPLAALDRAAALSREAEAAAAVAPEPTEVDRTALTFPERLGQTDPVEERPEVAALFAQASAELRRLEATSPPPSAPDRSEGAPPFLPAAPSAAPAQLPTTAAAVLPTTLPASVASTAQGRELVADSANDTLLAAALPAATTATAGQVGHEGRYSIQVASFRTPEEAELLAAGLRGKGHDTYVMEADIPGRGRFHRVRIGPFQQRGEARSYRQRLEAAEHLGAIVVRQRD